MIQLSKRGQRFACKQPGGATGSEGGFFSVDKQP